MGRVFCWHFERSLARLEELAGAEHRLEQPDEVTHSWELVKKAQPRQLGAAPSADSFSAAFGKLSLGKMVLPLSLHQTHGESSLWETGGVRGAEEQGLWAQGMEEGSLQRLREAGMLGLALLDHWEAPPAGNLLGGLASKSLPHGRTGVGQRHGQWGTKELEGPW